MGIPSEIYQYSKKESVFCPFLKIFIWKLQDSSYKYNNTHYNAIKMKPKDEKPDTYVEHIHDSKKKITVNWN